MFLRRKSIAVVSNRLGAAVGPASCGADLQVGISGLAAGVGVLT
jgi:hypothetical protein